MNSESPDTTGTSAAAPDKVQERLYTWQDKISRKKVKREAEILQKEQAQCPFKPQLMT